MAKLDFTAEPDVVCKVCFEDLEVEQDKWDNVMVQPCKRCLEEARKDACKEARGD